MRPIGFSTGALAKGDFESGIRSQKRDSITAIELSALRDHELPRLVEAAAGLDLRRFRYVSVHAPSKLQSLDEQTVFTLIWRLPKDWPVVVHPEIVKTPDLWRILGERLCLENMDNRKNSGRTFEEVRGLFEMFPEATFCLDVGHARQMDPTMASAILMLRTFGDRLRQVHVSDVGPAGEHQPVGALARMAFSRIKHLIPANCPLIIESIVTADRIGSELVAVSEALEEPVPELSAR